MKRLDAFYTTTGHRYSRLAGISEWCDATINLNAEKLNADKLSLRKLTEAIAGYLKNVVAVKRTVKRSDLAQAVEKHKYRRLYCAR